MKPQKKPAPPMTLSGKRTVIIFIPALILLVITAAVAILYPDVLFDRIITTVNLVNTHTQTPVFILLLVVLPVFGFPMTPFLMVMGMKFDLITGSALLALVMPVHFSASFVLAGLAGKFIRTIMAGRGYVIPRVPPHLNLRFCFLVIIAPVLPYSVKNYLLPLAGISFRTYLGISWPFQFILAMPMVILGSSLADMNAAMFGVAIIAFFMLYLIIRHIEKRMEKQVILGKKAGNKI